MAEVPQVRIKEAAKGLLFAAGLAANVSQAEARSAASTLAQDYRYAHAREVEAEIARYIKNPPR